MQVSREYIHIQFARQGKNYFENTKETFYTCFIRVSFMFHRMQPNTKLKVRKPFSFVTIIGYSYGKI